MRVRIPTFFRSVKTKLFGGFLAMALLIAGVGGYALVSVSNAGDVVTDTFDRPLMAVNFARSASQTFSALELETLRPSDPDNPQARLSDLSAEFLEDLSIARERSISPRAVDFFDAVEADFADWMQSADTTLSLDIEENLDIIVELQAGEAFLNRESAIETMARIRRISGIAVASALIMAIGLTVWIAFTIIRPLKAAAGAAAQISAGRLDVLIPQGGQDETGQLLRTMRSMQTTIRTRMEAEQDMRALAQNRLSDALETSDNAVLLTDADDRVVLANPGVRSLLPDLGEETELTGRFFASLFTPVGVPKSLASKPRRDDDETAAAVEAEFQLGNGRWLRVSASDTQEGGRLFIWNDITESRLQAENLRDARDAAEAASRAKTLFLAAMSHELNTPLNAIVGLSDVLRLRHESRGDADLADMAELISTSGGHMAQIVRDVLEISGDDTTLDRAKLETVSLDKAVEKAVTLLRPLGKDSNIRLLWNPPTEPVAMLGDAEDLYLLAVKLIDNAVKFNRPGGVVRVQLVPTSDDSVRLDVIDTGIGIARENLDRILQPFSQVDEGYTRSVDGTGLGLCVADRIARRHETRLQVRSVLGKGSVFSIIFKTGPQAITERSTETQSKVKTGPKVDISIERDAA